MTEGDTPADEPSKASDKPVKRSDVGFGRPPIEYQFKLGHKHRPRKKKETLVEVPMSETLRKVLNEERRVVVGGKVRWVTCADLVIMRAWQEAEKGSATLRREMLRLSLSCEAAAPEQAPLVITDPSAPGSATEFRLMQLDEDPR